MKFIATSFKVIGAMLVAATLMECVLRLFISAPIPYQHNPRLGWLPKPFARGVFGFEGYAVVQYNEFGFRDDLIGAEQPGEKRILCLGDSYTEGNQMSIDLTYPRQLQRLLRRDLGNSGTRLRVFNGGRSGTTAVFPVYLAEEYNKIFNPDWVVILIRDGWKETFNPEQEIWFKKEGGKIVLSRYWHWESLSPKMKMLIRWHVRDLALFQYGLRHYNELRRTSQSINKDAAVPEAENPLTPAPTRASTDVLQAIDLSTYKLKKKYPRLVIVHIPPSSPPNGLLPASDEEKRLIEDCEKEGIPCISMRPIIESDYRQNGIPVFGFANTMPWSGHPNSRGHLLIAKALEKFFLENDRLTKSNASSEQAIEGVVTGSIM